eukprot:gene4574-5176_t
MKGRTSSPKEDSNNCSDDQDRSFERTHGSYLACINRSLDHAFEFLSETGYASGGQSDVDRVESRNEEYLRSRMAGNHAGELMLEISDELIKNGLSDRPLLEDRKELNHERGLRNHLLSNIVEDVNILPSNSYIVLEKAKKEQDAGEDVTDVRKSKESLIKDGGSHQDDIGRHKERIIYRTDVDKTEDVMAEKDLANGKAHSQKQRIAYKDGEKKYHNVVDGKETMPYLTTERMIFKQMFNNAKKTEEMKHNQEKKSSKIASASPKKAAIPEAKEQQKHAKREKHSHHKGFKKFRESFRRKSSHFLPQKFTVQEDKKTSNDFTTAREFQYHGMQISHDNNEPISAKEGHKKKGFLLHLFERQKPSKFHHKGFFHSSDMINQMRAHSRDNLTQKAERPKSISLFIDKIRNQFTEKRLDGSTGSLLHDVQNEDFIHNGRHLPNEKSRFRRSESLRSIPSGYGVISQPTKQQQQQQPGTNRESIRILRSSHSRPISCHDLLSRACSADSNDSNVNLHKVLRNRYSCCSNGDKNAPAQFSDWEIEEEHTDAVFASSPRKDDDITEWIRGLQYSGDVMVGKDKRNMKKEAKTPEEIYDSVNYLNLLQQTRLVNGQIQTYL